MARVPPPKRKQAAYGLLKDYEKKKRTKTSPKTKKDVNGRLRYVGGSNAGQLVFPKVLARQSDTGGRLSDKDVLLRRKKEKLNKGKNPDPAW